MTEQTLATQIPGAEVDRATDHQSDWFLADGIPGSGPRPDFLEAKYKSVADQARAYKEAQKLIGTAAAAPEAYEFGDLREHIDQDNPHIQELITHAKEARIQQDTFNHFLKKFVDYDKSRQPDVNQEIAKLGPDGAQKITVLQNWVKNNLSEESARALERLPVKAEVVKMLDEIRQKHVHAQSRIPTDADKASTFKVLTVADVEAEMMQNYKRYQDDPGYRAQISQKFEQALGS